MKEASKHRLVGAIVLGCLAIIFLPILLDGEGIRGDAELERSGSRLPAAPPVPPVPDVEPRRPEILADSEEIELDSDSQGTEQTSAAEPEADAPSLDEKGLPRAWSVRLGTFAEAANARDLVERLLGAGHKGYSRPVSAAQGTLTAVYVGPVLSRGEADALRERLEGEFRLNGLVVQYSAQQGRD